MGRRMYKYADVEVEIEFDDVMEYITDHASDSEISEIIDELRDEIKSSREISTSPNGLDGSYIREEKMILLNLAANKYTLEELEKRLGGTKFDLI
jgi:hypothetical protein